MIIVISPAKKLDFKTPPTTPRHTQSALLGKAQELVHQLRQKSPEELAALMHLSANLAELNAKRFRQWQRPFTAKNAKQAVLAMRGDVYKGLDADNMQENDLVFAQEHLRILSGLYGVLRPLDLIQPYRLEMGCKLANQHGKNLYAFWGETITQSLNRNLLAQGDGVLINLASNEYFKAIKPSLLKGRIITPQFKDNKNGVYRIIGLFAKRARGQMARYIIDNRLKKADGLKAFKMDGYQFNEQLSKDDQWVFSRD